MPEQTLVQLRIAYALECIDIMKKGEDKVFSEYASYVKSLPAAVVMNGLGQAAATLKAQAKEEKTGGPHMLLYKHLGDWLCGVATKEGVCCPLSPYTGSSDLIFAIKANDQDRYLQAQYEALHMLQWLKKFADAFAPPKKKGDDNGTAVI